MISHINLNIIWDKYYKILIYTTKKFIFQNINNLFYNLKYKTIIFIRYLKDKFNYIYIIKFYKIIDYTILK